MKQKVGKILIAFSSLRFFAPLENAASEIDSLLWHNVECNYFL